MMQSRSCEIALHQHPSKSHSRCQCRLSRFHEHPLQLLKSDGHYRQLTSQVRRGQLFLNPDRQLMRPFCQTLQMLSDNSRTWDSDHQRHPKRRRRAFLVTHFRRLQELRLSVTDLTSLGIGSFLPSPCQQLQVRTQSGPTTFSVILLGVVPQLAITKKPHLSVLYDRFPQFVDQQQVGNVALRLNPIEQGLRLYPVQISATTRGIHHTVSGLNTTPISRKAHLRPKRRRKWSQCNREFHQLNPSQRSHQERRLLKMYLRKRSQRVLSDQMGLRRSGCWCANRTKANMHTDWQTPINCG